MLCLGATLGVALMNFDPKTINGRQVAKIFSGWVITLPAAVSHINHRLTTGRFVD